jgi:hypothetical protein
MSNSLHEELLLVPKTSTGLKVIAGLAAVAVAALLLGGYFFLRQRHADSLAASAPVAEPRPDPKAVILIDDATLGSGKSTLAGTVKNISNETLFSLQVELELKSRTGAGAEKRLVQVEPADVGPGQEGRYSVQLPVRDYASARLIGLKSGANLAVVPYTTGQGHKRQPERLEPKTITVDKPPPGTKRDEFLNSPDNPARVP